MSQTCLTSDRLSARIKYNFRTIHERLKHTATALGAPTSSRLLGAIDRPPVDGGGVDFRRHG